MAYRGFLAPGAKMGIGAPTWRVRLARVKGALSLTSRGSGAEPHPSTLLRAFGCNWNPFLENGNTVFNSACQTGKRQKRSLPLSRYWRVSGGAPAANVFGIIWV